MVEAPAMPIAFLAGMGAVAGSVMALAIAFVGIGLALRSAFGLERPSLDDVFLSFWVGFSVTLWFLILWNFAQPVGETAQQIVLVGGALGLYRSRHDLRVLFSPASWRPRTWEFLALAGGGLWVVNHAMAGFDGWDGVLYHVQTIKWAKTHAVIPGIANLHGPLAFNNSSFLYDAMVDSRWWEGRGFHVANVVVLFVAVLQAITNGLQWLGDGPVSTSTRCFGFVMLSLALYLARDMVSYSTDLPVALLLAVAAAQLYGLRASFTGRTGAENSYSIVALTVILVAAVSIKLSAAVFAAGALLLAIAVGLRYGKRREAGALRVLVWPTVILLAFGGAWIARGIVMSGYPFFPIAVAGFPVEWRAPSEHAQLEAAFIAFTERAFTWRQIGSNWLRLIFLSDINAVVVPSALAAAALLTRWRWKPTSVPLSAFDNSAWFALLVLVAILVWLATVPSHRYSPALFWSLAALSIAETLRVSAFGRRGRQWARWLVVAVAVSPLFVEPGWRALRQRRNPLPAIVQHNIVLPTSSPALQPLQGHIEVTVFHTRTGVALNTPKKTFVRYPLPNGCWNAPLPCTPNPAANLELRVPGALARGFKVTGPWEMEDWPYYWHSYFLPEWRMRRQ